MIFADADALAQLPLWLQVAVAVVALIAIPVITLFSKWMIDLRKQGRENEAVHKDVQRGDFRIVVDELKSQVHELRVEGDELRKEIKSLYRDSNKKMLAQDRLIADQQGQIDGLTREVELGKEREEECQRRLSVLEARTPSPDR